LIFVELPFAENVINYKFPKIKPEISKGQMDVVQELVDKMDLMTAGL